MLYVNYITIKLVGGIIYHISLEYFLTNSVTHNFWLSFFSPGKITYSYHIEGGSCEEEQSWASILVVPCACKVWVSKLQLLELGSRLISPYCMVKYTFLLTSKLVNLHCDCFCFLAVYMRGIICTNQLFIQSQLHIIHD